MSIALSGRARQVNGEPSMPQTDATISRPSFVGVIPGRRRARRHASERARDRNFGLTGIFYDAAGARFIHSRARRFGSEEPNTLSHSSAVA